LRPPTSDKIEAFPLKWGLLGCGAAIQNTPCAKLWHCFTRNVAGVSSAIHSGCPVNVPLNTYSNVLVQKLGPNPCFQQSITVFACKIRCVRQTPLMDDWYCLAHPEIIQAEA